MTDDVYGRFAPFYDLYVGDRTEDLPFYRQLATASGGPVLEIGAGSGRLTPPLARAGIPVTAVDVSAAMLAILRQRLAEQPEAVRRRVTMVCTDACDLALGETFGFVFVPFYTLNYFLTDDSARACLRAVARHMAPGARAAIDVFLPLRRMADCPTDPVLRLDRGDPSGGHVRAWNVYSIDEGLRIETRRHIFEVADGTGTRRTAFETRRRYFFPHELAGLFASAGLVVESAFGGYDRRPLSQDSELLVYVLRRND